MSLQKFMIVNAVPFGLARLQSNASKTIINISGGIGTMDSNDSPALARLKKTNKKIAHGPSLRMIKKRNKLFHRNSSSHVSQEKLKLQRGLLEQQLLDVKVEKMRLFLENEDLKLRCSSLEEENNFLLMQLQTSQNSEGLGSSTDIHIPDDNSGRIATQFSTKPINSIPTNGHLLHIQTLDEICDTSTWSNDTDVFVVPLSQDIINQPTSTDLNAAARMICHEEEISCEDKNGFLCVEEVETDQVDDISFPEPWTFDNLYEDPDDEVNFYV
ncbi:hypothetical protein AVEN_11833-1 [Araneus ventricosus]|uniref:Uncharacterized protein n=1 Tax=Araneus ventricosus TaxID=182803 RepID=A0A4Y2K7K2_ARAVE|nr:hypothetical protein AVEN_11833-1 [Araneus ventricosus]